MKQKEAIRACVFLEVVLLVLTTSFYVLAPIAHSSRGFVRLVLMDVLIVFVMFYVAYPGLDKD